MAAAAVMIYGDRVRAARLLRQEKAGSVAARMRWTPTRQTRIEQSETVDLQPGQLTNLARYLRFPEGYFTTAPPAPVAAQALLFHAPKSITASEKNREAEFARLAGEILEWLDAYHRLPPPRIPSLSSTLAIPEAARAIRDALRLGPQQPIGNLIHQIERAGVPIIVMAAPGEPFEGEDFVTTVRHQGYSTFVGEHGDRPITVLRPHESWERMRFVAAHELAHIASHGRLSRVTEDDEIYAHDLATELLAPAAALIPKMPKRVTLAGLLEMKMRWGISLGALIRHLHRSHLIDVTRLESLNKQLYGRINPATGQAWSRYEPGHDQRTPERPRMLTRWLELRFGVASANRISAVVDRWPADIVERMIAGQRYGPDQPPAPRSPQQPQIIRVAPSPSVVNIGTWKNRS
jgi:Zn-dependent peptidase ImmA (M78 family)